MRIVWRNARVLDMVKGFASIVWDLVCIVEVGECGACEKVVDRDGFFITAEITV